MAPYNSLDEQLEYNKKTGEVTKWHVKLQNKVDEIVAKHDICYDKGNNEGDCDRKMVKTLDEIPYSEMPKWGQTSRFLINSKQKFGLGHNVSKDVRNQPQREKMSWQQHQLNDELHKPIKRDFTRRCYCYIFR